MDEPYFSPLGIAIMEFRTYAARMLIESGIDLYEGYGMFGSALHCAIAHSNPEIVELILKHDLSGINFRNERNETPFHLTIQKITSLSCAPA